MVIKEKEKIAMNLMQQLSGIADNIFERNDLKCYLDLCVALDYLAYYNQLLIYRQFPNARLVAGSGTWKEHYSGEGEVLKRKYKTFGLDIIVPFLFGSSVHDQYLSFIPVKVYDISQTNIENYILPESIYVPRSAIHSELLLEALSAYISNDLHHRVVFEIPDKHKRLYPPGTITRFMVTVKEELSDYQKLLWLVESMAFLYYEETKREGYSEEFEILFISSICYMLLSRWQIAHPEIYLQNKALVKSIPKDLREEFCKVLQKGYRSIENSIQALYYYYRFGGSDPFDDEGMMF